MQLHQGGLVIFLSTTGWSFFSHQTCTQIICLWVENQQHTKSCINIHTRTHTLVSWSNVPSGGFTYSYLSASAEGYMGQFRVAHYVSNQSKATFIKIFLTLHTVFQSNKHSSLIAIIIHKQSICAVICRKKKKKKNCMHLAKRSKS